MTPGAAGLEYADSVEAVAEADMREQVLTAVRSLPETHRTVMTLFYINGYSQREIADFRVAADGASARRPERWQASG